MPDLGEHLAVLLRVINRTVKHTTLRVFCDNNGMESSR